MLHERRKPAPEISECPHKTFDKSVNRSCVLGSLACSRLACDGWRELGEEASLVEAEDLVQVGVGEGGGRAQRLLQHLYELPSQKISCVSSGAQPLNATKLTSDSSRYSRSLGEQVRELTRRAGVLEGGEGTM